MIGQLIDTPDNSEIVRDAIVLLLQSEADNQVAIATTDGKTDPTLWALDVYRENAQPVDMIDDNVTHVPIVSVRLGDMQIDAGSTQQDKFTYTTTYLIDILGGAKASATTNADTAAMLVVNRGVRLVRNILAASEYTRIGIPNGQKLIGKRSIESINYYTPDTTTGTVKAAGCQIRLDLKIVETSPQTQGEILDLVEVTTNRNGTEDTYFVVEFQK